MSATKQSDEPDGDVLRLEKFRNINTKGHASHSSIQKIMYFGAGTDDSVIGMSEYKYQVLHQVETDRSESYLRVSNNNNHFMAKSS